MQKLKTVADKLGVTQMTLWNWMYKGKIQFHKIGSMNYISDEDVRKLTGEIESKQQSVAIYARIYGQRRSKRKTERLIAELEKNEK